MKQIITLLFALNILSLSAQMSGTYTVSPNGSGPNNFNSITSAIQALDSVGINGPVVIDIASGTYAEQIEIPFIIGNSTTNTITILGSSDTTSPTTITYSPTNFFENYLIRLDSTRNVTIKNLTLVPTGNAFGGMITVRSSNYNISIMSIKGLGNYITSGSFNLDHFAFLMYEWTPNTYCRGNWVIKDNEVSAVSTFIELSGIGIGNAINNLLIRKNVVQSAAAMHIRYVENAVIDSNVIDVSQSNNGYPYTHIEYLNGHLAFNDNLTNCTTGLMVTPNGQSGAASPTTLDIHRNTFNTLFNGIQVFQNSSAFNQNVTKVDITNNKINVLLNKSSGTIIGIDLNEIQSTLSNPSIITNNMISIWDSVSTSTPFGLKLNSCKNVHVFHNSVSLIKSGVNPNSAGIYLNGPSNSSAPNLIINNIFRYFGPNTCLSIASNLIPHSDWVSDHNNYYTNGNHVARTGPFNAFSLSSWVAAKGVDSSSFNVDPQFVSPQDLHASATILNNSGIPLGVTHDFDGDIRSSTTPDIGADEFMPIVTCAQAGKPFYIQRTKNSFNINWIQVNSGASSYEVRYRVHGTTNYTTIVASKNLTGLQPNTKYDISIRDICGPGDTAAWSTEATLRTLTCNPVEQCQYTAFLHGILGSTLGWQNSGMRIYLKSQGEILDTLGQNYTSGPVAVQNFSLCQGDSIDIIFYHNGLGHTVDFELLNSYGDTVFAYVGTNGLNYPMHNMGTFITECRQSAEITFQVDMKNRILSPLGVHIMGNFQGWNPSTTSMVDPDGDGIYSYTMNSFVGEIYQYKFVNGSSMGSVEMVPSQCRYGTSSNRRDSVSSVTYTTPIVCYSECDTCELDIQLRVDMSWEKSHGTLANHVYVMEKSAAGTIQHLMSDLDNDGIYTVTMQIPLNSSFSYLFANDTVEEPSTNLSTCGVPFGGGIFFRTFQGGMIDSTLEVVCFSKCHGCTINLDELESTQPYVYPIPTTGRLYIEHFEGEYQIYSIENQIIYSGTIEEVLDLSMMPEGVYFLKIQNIQGCHAIRIIKI